jgi:signal peptidase II
VGSRAGRVQGRRLPPVGDAAIGAERSPHRVLLIVVAACAFAADQLTKWWALERLENDPIDLFWTFRFELTRNTGAAFSLAGGAGPIIAVLALGVVGFLLWQGRTISSKTGAVAMGLILGGALGNLADRAFRGDGFFDGGVVDFINPQWWPVFNVADSCVVVGGILLVVVTLFAPADDEPDEPGEPVERDGPGESASGAEV